MNWEQATQVLTRNFHQNEIKQRKGRKNMIFDYVPADRVVLRLNELGINNWSFIIKNEKEIGNEVVVLGSLNIMGVVREAYGSALRDENKDVGSCLKSSAALSLVKAASMFNCPCIFHVKPQQEQPRQEEREPNPQLPLPAKHCCAECATELTDKIYNWSMKNLGAALCLRHQRNRGAI
ncbi:Rad52/Rad22 family DNA repair protein [Paenibacillus contaminans]|uniref:Uncharacterized protein n=1 Tax=Paenibacillus contaminans TaxID=450362 RepID=A0A329MRU4_9BACL|nr:Rad52/Rad22 family DNA repair protein [Paenibacillus contaminans]RAV22689.1 hypothetical protein DQG23_00260 [Paenibacillus contaminans]